ncbi:MAG: hypothetical protein IPF50_18590 [Proteobacteria bacterium]|nr:hypothetical protein [Pseudomonadota bacterium]
MKRRKLPGSSGISTPAVLRAGADVGPLGDVTQAVEVDVAPQLSATNAALHRSRAT